MFATTPTLLGSLCLTLLPQSTPPQDFLKAFNQIDLDGAYEEGTWIDTDRGPVEIRDSGGLEVEGPVALGKPNARSGELEIYSDQGSQPMFELFEDSFGPRVQMRSATGSVHSYLSTAPYAGGGGRLNLGRSSSGAAGVLLDGNYSNSGNPRIFLSGVSGFMDFNLFQVGDNAVRLPDGAINSDEIQDEAGAASNAFSGSLSLNGSVQSLVSRTVTHPASGYVLAIGTVQVEINHLGLEERAKFGVSTSFGTMPAGQDVEVRVPPGAIFGFRTFPVTVQAVFPVFGSGNKTFYLLADKVVGGSHVVSNRQLSLVYLPSSYGSVVTPSTAAPAPDRGPTLDDAWPGARPLETYGPQEIAAERQQEEERYLDELFNRRRELLRDLEEQSRLVDEALARERATAER